MPIQQTTPAEAHRLMDSGYRYIDVRTEGEFAAGHPSGAVNIPVVLPDAASGQMRINPDFVRVVEAHFAKDDRIIVGCQVGGRSQRAAEILADASFSNVINMQGGFGGLRDATGHVVVAGWQESNLPVSTACGADNEYQALLRAAR
jgi:rhodanese-related sulfurtransferase